MMTPMVWSAWDAWECELKYFWEYDDAIDYCRRRIEEFEDEEFIESDLKELYVTGKVMSHKYDDELIVVEAIEIN